MTKAVLNKRFTIIEFENAGIVIRYPGNSFYRALPTWKQVKVIFLKKQQHFFAICGWFIDGRAVKVLDFELRSS